MDRVLKHQKLEQKLDHNHGDAHQEASGSSKSLVGNITDISQQKLLKTKQLKKKLNAHV